MRRKLDIVLRSREAVDGADWDTPSDPIQYSVVGMPPGEVAEIAKLKPKTGKWAISRRTEGTRSEWKGAYNTAKEALAALEHAVNQ